MPLAFQQTARAREGLAANLARSGLDVEPLGRIPNR